jgi:site-specific DNA recombinase
LEEKLAKQAVPEGKFGEMFVLSMKFLASPWNIWEKGSYELKRTVLRMAFSGTLSVSRETGLQTAETTLPFKALRFLSMSESQMVRAVGLEPTRAQGPTDFKSGMSTIPSRPQMRHSIRLCLGPKV